MDLPESGTGHAEERETGGRGIGRGGGAREPAPAASGGQRFRELDAMRGLAAMVVVLDHFSLTWIFPYSREWSWRRELLHPLFAGDEAVVLFFLLSGFVLSLPYVRGSGLPYPLYLLRRILRIYGPYLFGLALAVAGDAAWHGRGGAAGWTLETWAEPVSWRHVLEQVVMIGDYNWLQFNTAFWSLVVEMRLSIVFPLLLLLVRRMGTGSALAMAAAGSLVLQRMDGRGDEWLRWGMTLQGATIFGCGIMMAMHLPRLGAWYRGMSRMGRAGVGAASLALFGYSHMLDGLPGTWRLRVWHIGYWAVVAGAAGMMLMGMESRRARAVLNSAVPRFLGRISYSLYLVHGTVLLGVSLLLLGKAAAGTVFAVYLAVTVVLALGLCVWVEEPFARLGRRLGR